MSITNAKYIESKLNKAAELLLAAQTEIADALESAKDSESHEASDGAKKLFDSAAALIRANNREKFLVKHGDAAPKAVAIYRSF